MPFLTEKTACQFPQKNSDKNTGPSAELNLLETISEAAEEPIM